MLAARRSRFVTPILMLALGLFVAASAGAVPVNITYQTQYRMYTAGFAFSNPTQQGSLTLQFANGTVGGAVLAGPVHVVSGFNKNATFLNLGPYGALTGTLNILLPGSGAGTLTGGGNLTFGSLGVITQGFIHCNPGSGPSCSLYNPLLPPPSIAAPLTGYPFPMGLPTMPYGVGLAGPMSGPGGASAGNFNVSAMTGSGLYAQTWRLQGQEVSRNVIPEPNTAALLGLGLAGLGLGGGAVSRRRRAGRRV